MVRGVSVGLGAAALLTACSGNPVPDAGPAASGAATAAARTATATAVPVPERLPWGPTAAELDQARRAVAAMSPDRLAGQVVVARYTGTDPAAAADLIRRHHLAGVILMGDNVAGAEQVRATADAVQAAVRDGGRTWPGVVAVDEEGGQVSRVPPPATEFPTFMTHGAAQAPRVTADAARASGEELRALGFTVVFAPVTDVTSGPDDPTIGSRSASDDPQRVSRAVASALRGYARAGIVPVVKHYPGHGSVPADSHETLPVQDAEAEELAERDLVPFTAAARAGAPAVMMSHVAVQAWDPGVPASLSPRAYAALRQDTGFDGVAVTDALDMAAVTAEVGSGEAAVRALAAGADVLLMPSDAEQAASAVAAALTSGELPRERVEEAAARVVAMTRVAERSPPPSPGSLGSAAPASHAASAAGITLVEGPCSERLVGDAVRAVGGTETDRARFADAAREAGLGLGSGDVVRLLGGATATGPGDVVVALDAPYGLGDSAASTARIALYGRTPQAFAALVDVLLGRAGAPGTLPVDVDGFPRGTGCPR